VEVKIELQNNTKEEINRESVDYLMDEGSFEEIGVLVTPYH
jgi:acetyl-CoA carboxylase carboxyltransferase component